MAKAKRATIVLVRTGRTVWDEQGRLAGQADLPLAGEALDALGPALTDVPVGDLGCVLCGPDEASVLTAKQLAGRANEKKPRISDRLGEVSLGLWDGSRRAELEDRCPTVFKRWVDDPSSVAPPEGEPFAEAAARLAAEIARLVEKRAKERDGHAGVVAVVLKPIAWALVAARLEARPLRTVRVDCTREPVMSVYYDTEIESLRREPEPQPAVT